jgi:hypothetical protein
MIAKITATDEQHRVLQTERESPVVIVDSQGKATHVVLPIEDARRMLDSRLAQELQIGFDQADRGEWVEWDPERIKAEGRRLLHQRSNLSP